MNKGNGNSAPLGVLAEITALLTAITPEQFVTPPTDRGEGDHAVAAATDDIKRFFTLRCRLIDKCSEFKTSVKQTAETAMEEISAKGVLQADKDLETPGTSLFEAKAKFEQIVAELQRVDSLFEIIDGIFWREVQNQHPDLVNKPTIGIRSDWSLTWTEKEDDDDDGAGIRVCLVGSSDLAGLDEMLARHGLTLQ